MTIQGNFNPHRAIMSTPPPKPPPLTRSRRITREEAEQISIEIREHERLQRMLDTLGQMIASRISDVPTLKTLAFRQLSSGDMAYARDYITFVA
jgi:hypothetical protein